MNRLVHLGGQLAAALVLIGAAATPANAAATVAQDAFTRTVAGGWGSADTGGAWSVGQGPASALNVASGEGVLDTPAGYSNLRIVHLASAPTRDVDAKVKMTLSGVSGTGGSAYGALLLRRQADGSHYRVGLWAQATGKLIMHSQTSAGETVAPDVDTGIVFTPGAYMLRVQLQGANPTTIRAKAWKAGTVEPTTWRTEAKITRGPQVAGTLGIRTSVASTTSPVTFKFDDFNVMDMAPPPPDPSTWKLMFNDDFSGTALNTASWSAFDGPGNGGNGVRRPAQITVANGVLTSTSRMINGVLNSGGVAHRVNYTYGRFEFRVRTDPDPSGATSGTVLTWPSFGGWPATGENDIYETGVDVDRTPFYSFIHYSSTNQQYFNQHFVDGTQWHVMAMEWSPTAIRIYRDGELVYTVTDANAIPDGYHRFGIQLDALKSTMTGTVNMQVDYVRIFQLA
jgi:Glycosyl hydrolases family 16